MCQSSKHVFIIVLVIAFLFIHIPHNIINNEVRNYIYPLYSWLFQSLATVLCTQYVFAECEWVNVLSADTTALFKNVIKFWSVLPITFIFQMKLFFSKISDEFPFQYLFIFFLYCKAWWVMLVGRMCRKENKDLNKG